MRSLFSDWLASFGHAASERGITHLIDKSKPGYFKPLSLDVIFHGCEDIAKSNGYTDAFARQRLRKPAI
jgi:hypothetical protein